jgi:hypothetical protein
MTIGAGRALFAELHDLLAGLDAERDDLAVELAGQMRLLPLI